MSGTRVQLQDVRLAFERTMHSIEEQLGERIELNCDHYWHLPVEAAFTISIEPSEITAGQLTDDLIGLATTRDPEVVPELAWHERSHLIGVLRALQWRLQVHTS